MISPVTGLQEVPSSPVPTVRTQSSKGMSTMMPMLPPAFVSPGFHARDLMRTDVAGLDGAERKRLVAHCHRVPEIVRKHLCPKSRNESV
jgi:hypothetical protein